MLLPPDASFVPSPSHRATMPACLGLAPPRVQGRQKSQSRNSLLRPVLAECAIFVRDPEPVPFEAMPVHASKRLPPSASTATKDDPASVRPSRGLDVIRTHAYAPTRTRCTQEGEAVRAWAATIPGHTRCVVCARLPPSRVPTRPAWNDVYTSHQQAAEASTVSGVGTAPLPRSQCLPLMPAFGWGMTDDWLHRAHPKAPACFNWAGFTAWSTMVYPHARFTLSDCCYRGRETHSEPQ